MRQKVGHSAEEVVAAKVAASFSDAQRTSVAHTRASKQLITAYQVSAEEFLAYFIQALNRVLIIFSRDPPVERLIQFVAQFTAAETEKTGSFCSTILAYLTFHSNARNHAVRFRTVQLIAAILQQLPPDAEISGNVLGPLQEAVFTRAFDRVPRVRAAAAGALCRMQTSGDAKTDDCTISLVSLLTSDSSTAVRKAAIQAVAITESTIPHILGRLRDVNSDVRRVTYEVLASKVDPSLLHKDDFILILRQGLQDRSKVIRDICREKIVLEAWMETHCSENVFDLVDLLGCHSNEIEVLHALKVVFESSQYAQLVESTEIDVNNLSHDDVLILRGLCEAKRGDGGVDKFIPTTLAYSEVLKYYAIDEFASRHLLELCKCIDMSDEVGRRALEEVIRVSFLSSSNTSEDVVGSAVKAMRRTMLDDESTARLILEIVRHDVLKLYENDENEVNQTNESDEQVESQEGPDEQEDRWKQSRALNITLETLKISSQSANSASSTNMIYKNLLEMCVIPNVFSEDEDIRRTAMECIGLFCLLDKSGNESKDRIEIFMRCCESDVDSIKELALKVMVDMLMLYDFSKDDDKKIGQSTTPLSTRKRRASQAKPQKSIAEECLTILTHHITHVDGCMRTTAVQGLARLLYVRRFAPSSLLLSRMLIAYFNPTTEDDAELRQSLTVFFPVFASMGATNRIALEDAAEPMCRVLLQAPKRSPLSKISVVQVLQFIISLTGPGVTQQKGLEGHSVGQASDSDIGRPAGLIHERLAEFVLNEIIGAIHEDILEDARVFAKVLTCFRFKRDTENDDILDVCERLAKVGIQDTSDRRLKMALTKFRQRLLGDQLVNIEEVVDLS